MIEGKIKMKYMKIPLRIFAMLFNITVIFTLISCSSDTAVDKNEVLEHLRSKIYETAPITDETVFWVKGGSVYHLYRDCRFLENADEIRYGAVAGCGRTKVCETCAKRYFLSTEQAETEFTEEVPDSTNDTDDSVGLIKLEMSDQTENDPQDRIINEIVTESAEPSDDYQSETVYWTPSGSVWHTDPNCSSLARSKDVRSGTVAQSGKQRACKICSPSD